MPKNPPKPCYCKLFVKHKDPEALKKFYKENKTGKNGDHVGEYHELDFDRLIPVPLWNEVFDEETWRWES